MRHLAGYSSSFLSALFARTPRANEVIRPKSAGRLVRFIHHGSAFNAGRNAEKRAARRREQLMRKAEVDAYLTGLPIRTESPDGRVITFTGRHPVPKRHMSHLMIDMLANRRLRQHGRLS